MIINELRKRINKSRKDKRPIEPGWLTAIRWASLVLLAAYLLFAHGCDPGDHDEELYAPLRWLINQH